TASGHSVALEVVPLTYLDYRNLEVVSNRSYRVALAHFVAGRFVGVRHIIAGAAGRDWDNELRSHGNLVTVEVVGLLDHDGGGVVLVGDRAKRLPIFHPVIAPERPHVGRNQRDSG